MVDRFTSTSVDESISSPDIKEMMRQSIQLELDDPPFLCCIKTQTLATHFCCASVPIQRGLIIMGFFDLLISSLSIFFIAIGYIINNKIIIDPVFSYHAVQVLGIIECFLCLAAAKKLNVTLAKICYRWKLWEIVILDGIEIYIIYLIFTGEDVNLLINASMYICLVCLIFILMLRIIYGLYSTYIIYSFIVLIEKKQGDNLVVYGVGIIKYMENIRKQAEAIEMRTEHLSKMEVAFNT